MILLEESHQLAEFFKESYERLENGHKEVGYKVLQRCFQIKSIIKQPLLLNLKIFRNWTNYVWNKARILTFVARTLFLS